MGIREQKQALTRAKIIEVARAMFEAEPYGKVTARRVADVAGLTTGGVYCNFANKAEIWWAAMGTPPPVDSPTVRSAAELESALAELVRCRNSTEVSNDAWTVAWKKAEKALGQRRPDSAQPPARAKRTSPGRPKNTLSSDTVSDLKLTAERRWAVKMTPRQLGVRLKAVSQAFALYELGSVTGAQVYRLGLEAAVEIIVSVTRGLADHPYQFELGHSTQLRNL